MQSVDAPSGMSERFVTDGHLRLSGRNGRPMGRGTLRVSLPGEWSPNRPREGEFAVAPARSIHRDRASNGDAVHPQRPAQLCRRARFRWSSDLSFDALRCRPLRCVGILNGMTAKYATLQNCISAAQRGILTSREVSGGGLEPAVAWCHEQATCATGQVIVGEGLPVATLSHGLTRGDVPTWEQASDLVAGYRPPYGQRARQGPAT
jgi:hypothetical protein